MRKRDSIALILTVSVLMSMTGCSSFGQKKKIIEVAENYAGAMLSGDADSIAEFVMDDDDFSEVLEEYLDKYNDKKHLEDVYSMILDNMSYEVDKSSVSIKDTKAKIDITYTVINYMDIYEELRDRDDEEDYLEALEDEMDNTIDISLTMELKSDKGEWKIVDDNARDTLKVYSFYSDIGDLVWINSISPLSRSDFSDACEAVGMSCDDWGYGEYSFMSAESGSVYFSFEDNNGFVDFEQIYDSYLETINDDDYTGYTDANLDGNTGYIIFNVSATENNAYQDYYYGGIYYVDGSVLMAYTTSRGSSNTDKVDEFLDEIGYPKPH